VFYLTVIDFEDADFTSALLAASSACLSVVSDSVEFESDEIVAC
jgi:hypothetical protein